MTFTEVWMERGWRHQQTNLDVSPFLLPRGRVATKENKTQIEMGRGCQRDEQPENSRRK